MPQYISAIGQDSHRFVTPESNEGMTKPLILGGVSIPESEGLDGNSDADVVLHAITNAISGISCINVLGAISDEMCLVHKITDSREYVKYALGTLRAERIIHISISIECSRPKLVSHIETIRNSIGNLIGLEPGSIGITATSGEGLTDFGRGLGIQAFCVITAVRDDR